MFVFQVKTQFVVRIESIDEKMMERNGKVVPEKYRVVVINATNWGDGYLRPDTTAWTERIIYEKKTMASDNLRS